MQLKETQAALRAFGKYVVQQARTNLTKGSGENKKYGTKNVSKELYNSVAYDIDEVSKGFRLYFEMEDYGMFQDRGVKGVKGGKSLSNFSYKQSSNLVGLESATGTFAKWAEAKRKQLRDKKGRFLSYKQTGFALATIVKNYGIKPSLFFTKPFEKGFKDLPTELQEQFAIDLENLITD
jgi:hypothetical protein